jgi:hypothetical protein
MPGARLAVALKPRQSLPAAGTRGGSDAEELAQYETVAERVIGAGSMSRSMSRQPIAHRLVVGAPE